MADLRIGRVVVTGGRGFTDGQRIEADLRALMSFGLRRVAEGQCHKGGADDLAYDAWHLLVNRSTERYPVDHSKDGRWPAAGNRRNVRMLDAEIAAGGVDLVLAYPDPKSKGTWACIEAALKRNLPVAIWAPFINAVGVAARLAPTRLLDDEPRFILNGLGIDLRLSEVLRG